MGLPSFRLTSFLRRAALQDASRVRLWCAALLCAAILNASGQQGVVVRDFRVALERFPAPNERQVKTLVEGTSAQPQAGGLYLVSGTRLTTFTETGITNMEVSAPEALLDQKQRIVSSPGPLKVRTADGKFSIEGLGFLWRQTNSDSGLIISNQVKTIVHPDLLHPSAQQAAATNETRGPVQILSDTFQYSSQTELGVYRGNVTATGPEMHLSGGQLSVEVPVPGSKHQGAGLSSPGTERSAPIESSATTTGERDRKPQVRSISVEEDVVLDYQGVHATGQQAVYSVAEGLLLVSGRPQWKTEHREGSADQISIDPSNRVFRAMGNASLKLSGPELSQGSFLGGLGPAGADREKAVKRELVFASENYEFRTNQAAFSGGVQVQERLDDKESGRLTSQTLELELAGTNQLQRMVAEREVKLEQGTRQFTGGMLVYDATQEDLLLTEQPEWRDGPRAGKGHRMQFDLKAKEMLVSGEAWMRLPAGEFALTAAGTLGQATNGPAGTNAFAEISSSEYRLGQTSGEFRGDVRVSHPQMKWTSDVVTLRFPPGGGTAEEIVAVPADFQMTDPKGQTILGEGQKAVYTLSVTANSTNSLLELTGSPASLSMTNGMTVVSRVLLFDVASSRLFAPSGSYKITGQGGSFGDTNAFRLPKMTR